MTGSAIVAGAGTATVVASTGEGRTGAPRATDTTAAIDAMVGTINAGTACIRGTSIQEDPDETQESIRLPATKFNLAKELYKTPTHEQRRLAAQIHTFLLHDSPDLT